MTTQQLTDEFYYNRNRLGFEGDTLLKEYVENLIKKHKIKTILEGGTYLGSTTKLFAKMAKTYSIEIDKTYYETAKDYLTDEIINKSVELFEGSTLQWMPILLEKIKSNNYLFFCDSHWGSHNPLIEELAIIAKLKQKPFIIIHDFKVPNDPTLGYDSYNGQDYDFNWIKSSLELIYGVDGYQYEYNNDNANGAKRGIISIKPKRKK